MTALKFVLSIVALLTSISCAAAEKKLFTFTSIQEAKAHKFTPEDSHSVVLLSGHTEVNDGGGGFFVVNSAKEEQKDDGGISIITNDGTSLTRIIEGQVNVRWFGAKGNGKDDDTEAIRSAWNYCTTASPYDNFPSGYLTSKALYFPPGNYVFSGPSLSFTKGGKTFKLISDGPNGARISLTRNEYFISVGDISSLQIEGLQFVGGKGALRINTKISNVRGFYIVRDSSFYNYSECAIGHNSIDMPTWQIQNNTFFGHEKWTSIGVALNGLADGSIISGNQFIRNAYGLKINGGYNAYVKNNAFFRFTKPITDATDIWIIPSSTSVTRGLIISENKFGNENLNPTDFRILVASEDNENNSKDFLESHHSKRDLGNSQRTGYFRLINNNFESNTGYSRGIISSYTSDIRSTVIDNLYSGSRPREIIQYLGQAKQNRLNSLNMLATSQFTGATEEITPPLSTGIPGLSIDPWGLQTGSESHVQYFSTGDDPSYEEILKIAEPVKALRSPAQNSRIDGPDGRPNAAQYKFGPGKDTAEVSFIINQEVKPTWIEFDFKAASQTSEAGSCIVQVLNESTKEIVFKRNISTQKSWNRARFLWIPNQSGQYKLVFTTRAQESSLLNFSIHGIHVYQAHEPVYRGPIKGDSIELSSQDGSFPKSRNTNIIFIDSRDGKLKIRTSRGDVREIVTN